MRGLQTLTRAQALIFAAGLVSLFFSLYLWFTARQMPALFVGLWVPSLWTLALLVGPSLRRVRRPRDMDEPSYEERGSS